MFGKNYFTSAFDQIEKDNRLLPSHIAIYVVLLNLWSKEEFQNPINVSRREMLLLSKVNSQATYHKCMKELNDFGYIKYSPSYNPYATKQDLEEIKTEILNEIRTFLKAKRTPQEKEWLKAFEVRKLLGISPGTLQNMRINGTITYTKLGGLTFYRYEDIV